MRVTGANSNHEAHQHGDYFCYSSNPNRLWTGINPFSTSTTGCQFSLESSVQYHTCINVLLWRNSQSNTYYMFKTFIGKSSIIIEACLMVPKVVLLQDCNPVTGCIMSPQFPYNIDAPMFTSPLSIPLMISTIE